MYDMKTLAKILKLLAPVLEDHDIIYVTYCVDGLVTGRTQEQKKAIEDKAVLRY